MYREQTAKGLKRRRTNRIIAAVVLVAAAVGLWLLFLNATSHTSEQGAASVRQSILDTAMQCCAIEGSYPSSLKYLEDHYGLVINRADYAVSYEAFAGNILPTVVVTPR